MSLSQLLKSNKIRFVLYMLLAQGLFMLSNLYINHWVNKTWEVEGFATFNLIKRIGSFAIYPLLVGAGIGIPRYISFLKSKASKDSDSYEYLLSGFIIFIASFLLFSAVVWLFPGVLLKSFEGTVVNQPKVIWSILLFILSQGLFVLLSAFYRGKLEIGKVSLFNIVVMSAMPLAGLFLVDNVFTYFYDYSLATLVLLVLVTVYLYFKNAVSFKRIKFKTGRLFNYGYPRIIAELGLFALEFMPIFLISFYIGLRESGYLSMTFILLKLAAMGYELIGSLILPYFGKLYKQASSEVFMAKVNQMILIGFVCGIFIAGAFYLLIPIGIQLFFPSLSNAIVPSQFIFMVFPVYSVYLLLRNVLDIVSEKALNSIHLSIVAVLQLAILMVGFYLKETMIYSILSIVIPFFFLGLLTYLAWGRVKERLR